MHASSSVTEGPALRSVVATVEREKAAETYAARTRFDWSDVMTLYILFAGLGILIYASAALAETAIAAFSDAHLTFGFQLFQVAYVASLSVFFAAVVLLHANRVPSQLSSTVGYPTPAARRERILVVAFLLFGAGIAIFIGATADAGHALACAGQCGAARNAIVGEESLISGDRSRSVVAGGDSQALAVGTTLFEERGCAGCHRADSTGVGPRLDGFFGSPVQNPACGVSFVDESYLREAIENPSGTLAVGSPHVMPSFAGLTESELQALIEYLKSLGARPYPLD